jgi:hypothetical protein
MKIEGLLENVSVADMLYDGEIIDPVEENSQNNEKPEGGEPSEKPTDPPKENSDQKPADKNIPKIEGEDQKQGSEDQPDDTGVIQELRQKFGFDFGETEFEESLDGVYEMSLVAAEKMAESKLDQFFENFPDLAEYAEYRINGGDPAKYFETISKERDYSQISITEDDAATQRVIVDELLKRQGFDDESRQSILSAYAKTNSMFTQAQAALPVLSKLTAGERKKLADTQALKARNDEAERARELTEINNLIKAGSFKGIQIPEADKTNFAKWMFQADKTGKTGRAAARESMTKEDMLALEYLVYKGFKLNDLIQKRAETLKAKDLKSLIKDKSGSRMKDDNSQREFLNIPSITDLLG